MKINDRTISQNFDPYIVAEVSANHNGRIESALELIALAKEAGADAVKIQTYTPDTITLNSRNPDFMLTEGLWAGKSLYELYQEAHTPWEWHHQLFDFARNLGITIFSSPFDSTAVDFLEELGTPAYKIASFEIVDLPLLKRVAQTGKPVIVSTGLANLEEIEQAINVLDGNGCRSYALLHCVSAYPAKAEDYNLATIVDLKNRFQCEVGLSDHTVDNTTAIASVALGSTIIEKHFTLDRNGGGPDDSFSMEPEDLSSLVRDCRQARKALGCINYQIKEGERSNLTFRRSLYYTKDLTAGSVISEDNVRSVRPGFGLPVKFLPDILGKRVNKQISAFERVELSHLE